MTGAVATDLYRLGFGERDRREYATASPSVHRRISPIVSTP